MIIHELEQGTPEWHKVRCGKFTASNIHKLFMGKSTKGYNDYLNQIVYERLTGEQPESFSSEWMDRGIELEAEAIQAYELLTFSKVTRVGFVEFDDWHGCSPDGFVGEYGMLQVKCPKWSTMLDDRLNDPSIPKEYLYQMQFEMMVSERKWNDYFCYHPKLEPILKRVEYDKSICDAIAMETIKAEVEIEKRLTKLKG